MAGKSSSQNRKNKYQAHASITTANKKRRAEKREKLLAKAKERSIRNKEQRDVAKQLRKEEIAKSKLKGVFLKKTLEEA